ncbi:hypothetical protein CEXT_572941 [Caerostris extrusa]|uniref:Uncharacterized protein n=1 Tax=Caerostris extrusa TaxID=172846 RepID=A0AAV4XU68_CAEEX|nr:hypothetical protein CEXT_572941 [Caerostris extrusa]
MLRTISIDCPVLACCQLRSTGRKGRKEGGRQKRSFYVSFEVADTHRTQSCKQMRSPKYLNSELIQVTAFGNLSLLIWRRECVRRELRRVMGLKVWHGGDLDECGWGRTNCQQV